jgi:hypothetical protein
MQKKYIFFKIILIITACNAYSDNLRVLVLPFLNKEENMELEYISEVIPNSFNLLVDREENYTAVTYDELVQYMNEHNMGIGDFYNPDVLLEFAEYFDLNNIVRGEYYEDDLYTPKRIEFKIEYIEINENDFKINYNMRIGGRGGIYTFDTLDMIVDSMLNDFLGVVMEYAYLEVITDIPCELYIDELFVGITPVENKRVAAGNHNIKLMYEDSSISGYVLNENISFPKNIEVKIEQEVFSDILIEAEEECSVFINNEYMGITPYKDRLINNNEYLLKMVYINRGKEEIITEQTIDTISNKPLSLYFPVTGSLKILTDNTTGAFNADISGLPPVVLPCVIDPIPLGNYSINVYVNDLAHDNTYNFYLETFAIEPGENKDIDLAEILDYESKPGFCLIPGLSQIYNRQKVKGIITAVSFGIGVLVAASAPLARYIYTEHVLNKMVDVYNNEGLYTPEQIADAERKRDNIFKTFLISGISLAAGSFLYSLIDGAINMRRLNLIINFGYNLE